MQPDPASGVLNHATEFHEALTSLRGASHKAGDHISADLYDRAATDVQNATRHIREAIKSASLIPKP